MNQRWTTYLDESSQYISLMMIPQNILTIFLKHKVEARFVFSNLQQLLLKRLYS